MYEIINNIKCYAPELAHANKDFPVEAFEVLYAAEEGHFWFESRNRVIQHLFSRFVGKDYAADVLEIGCGTGFVLKGLSEVFPQYRLKGSEFICRVLLLRKSDYHRLSLFNWMLPKCHSGSPLTPSVLLMYWNI